jgi:hypothetical protein
MSRSPRRSPRAIFAALALALVAGCASVREALSPPPRGAPSGRPGWLVYPVGGLRFEASDAWRASGDARHLQLEAPSGDARLEVSTPDPAYLDEKACMAAAQEVMRRAESMERVRKHLTRFAGAPAVTVEGDQRGWHVWAWAACDGGTQYRVFFTARTPAPASAIEAYRALVQTARIGGQA